jgi:hypothetical protein
MLNLSVEDESPGRVLATTVPLTSKQPSAVTPPSCVHVQERREKRCGGERV